MKSKFKLLNAVRDKMTARKCKKKSTKSTRSSSNGSTKIKVLKTLTGNFRQQSALQISLWTSFRKTMLSIRQQ